ncbi:MAG: DUF1669 domain-containing protein [Candidatus Sericytochromatia bacterium]|nr:DUF1669 domain-containing protein [Candidatus Sericytochromatia bacterium]
MSKIRLTALALLTSTLAATLSACGGQQMPYPNPMMNRAPMMMGMNNRAPVGFSAFGDVQAENQLFTTHFVNAYAETIAENEPRARQDANGPAQALLAMINNARHTLDGAFYDMGDIQTIEALVQAKQRGVQVRIVAESENMLPRTDAVEAKNPQWRDTILRLQQAGIPVRGDERSGLMHHKFMIADGQAVWMGSTNMTNSSLYNHNNNAITIRNKQIAENYQSEFERMFTHGIFGPQPPRQLPHPVVRVGNSTIQTFFSPRGGGQEAIMQTLNQAQKRISFMTFSFTDKEIANLMIQKKQAGLRVDGVYDQCLGYGQYSTYHMMRQAGIHTRMDGNEALLHHKTILADDTVITGSFNFSANADKTNNENMLIIQNSYVTASYYQEYDRVMTAAINNRPPKNKCPGE